mgnify:CR=1 FL=1
MTASMDKNKEEVKEVEMTPEFFNACLIEAVNRCVAAKMPAMEVVGIIESVKFAYLNKAHEERTNQ